MSWIRGLNDSFEHFGGQISNFTKEVLAEDSDDVTDYKTEAEKLKLSLIEARTKLIEQEKQFSQQVNEISALKQKSRQDELAINQLTHQFNAHKRLLGGDGDIDNAENLRNFDQFQDIELTENDGIQTNAFQMEKEILQNKIKDLEGQLKYEHSSFEHEIFALKNEQLAEKERIEKTIKAEREEQEEVYRREFTQLCIAVQQIVVEAKTEEISSDDVLNQVTTVLQNFQSSIDLAGIVLQTIPEAPGNHDNVLAGPESPQFKFNPSLTRPKYQSSPQVARRHHLHSDPNESSPAQQGDLTLTLEALQKQVDDYELEIAQYEEVQNAWHTEKQALQNMLDRYENVQAKKGTEQNQTKESKSDDHRAAVITQLREELRSVMEVRGNMEKDKQRLLQEKDKLQSAVSNLEEELNVSMKVIEEVKDQQSNLLKDLNQVSLEKNKLENALKNVSDELNCSREERDGLNEAVESLDSQHQEEMIQILIIRDQINEKLKSTQEEKLELQQALNSGNKEMQSKEKETEKLLEKIAILEEKLSQSDVVSNESVSLKNNLNRNEELNLMLQTEMETLTTENKKMSENLTELREKITNSETSENNLKNNLETLGNEKMISVNLVEELRSKLEILHRENQGFQEKISEYESKSSNFVESLEKSKKDGEKFREKISGLETENSRSETLIETLKAHLETLNSENDEMSLKLLEAESENEDLVERLGVAVSGHTGELESAERRISEMEGSRRKLEEEQFETKKRVEGMKTEFISALEKLEQEKRTLEELLKEEARKCKDLESGGLSGGNLVQEQEEMFLEEIVKEETKKSGNLETGGHFEGNLIQEDKNEPGYVTVLKEEKQGSSDGSSGSSKDEELMELNEHNLMLRNEIEDLEKELNKVKEESSSLFVKLSDREDQISKLSDQIQSLQDLNSRLQNSYSCLEEKNTELNAALLDFEAKNSNLEGALKNLTLENEKLNENIFKFEENVKGLEKDLLDFNEMKNLNLRFERNITELTDENERLNTDLENLNVENIELQENLEQFKENLQKEIKEKKGLIKSGEIVNQKLHEYESRITDIQVHSENENSANKHLKEQIKQLQTDVFSSEEKSNELERINQETNNLLTLKESNITDLKAEINILEQKCEKINSESQNLIEEKSVLIQKITQLRDFHEEEIIALRSENVTQNALKTSQIEALSEKNKVLASDLSSSKEYRSRISDLEAEVAQMKISAEEGRMSNSVQEMLGGVEDLGEVEKGDLSKEDIGSLLNIIRERDALISHLRMKLKSSSHEEGLEERFRMLDEEKSQILSVVSEKTRENRQLKDELHKMVDSVAASKTALLKTQSENQDLVERFGGMDAGMTKEAVSRLSNLVSEKDLEIEALKLKCQTLLDVMQQDAKDGAGNQSAQLAQIPALLRDRETMNQQIHQLLTERNHLVSLINGKQKELVDWQEKATKVAESSEHDSAENCNLQIRYSNLVHDYEQIELKLNSTRKELSACKEAANHLEEAKELILSKLEIDSTELPQTTASHRHEQPQITTERSVSELENILERKSESLLQKDILLNESREQSEGEIAKNQRLLSDIREKDILLHQCKEEAKQISSDLTQRTNEVSILRKSVENLREQVSATTKEAEIMRERFDEVEKVKQEKENESLAFQETNAQLSVLLKEKEYENESLREKSSTLNLILQEHEKGKESESQKYLGELDRAKESAVVAKHERDQILLTLKQKQLESQRNGDETRQLRDKQSKLQSELQRLRSHLLQVEETYTQEAMLSEERENQLRTRLNQLQTSQLSIKQEGQQTQQQVESLQEQLRSTIAKRDQAILDCQMAQEQSQKYASALQQLQAAAERMQKEEAATYAARVEKINQQYYATCQQAELAVQQSVQLQAKLEEANVALVSASRLNEQLEIKEQSIDNLKELVSEKQLELDELHDKLHEINSKTENMIDRQLVKNLFMGYFTSPTNKQKDVVRLISSVIGFSKDEEEKLNPDANNQGWTRGWLSWGQRGGSTPATPRASPRGQPDLNTSFTDMFVKFLEEESTKTKAPTVRLPAARMVDESQRKMNQRKLAAEGIPTPAFNPPWGETPIKSTVAGRYNPLLTPSTSAQGSHLLAPMTPILPTFTPVSKSSGEKNILQGILQSE